jgi:cytosine deaminase
MALEAATYSGARALGLEAYGLEPGARADIVVVDASTPAEAVVTHPVRTLVVKAGRVVAREGALVR